MSTQDLNDEYDLAMREYRRDHRIPATGPLSLVTLYWCGTRGCDRKTTAKHCCSGCAIAHAGGHEVHAHGPLAHSEGCDDRHEERTRTACA